MTEKILRIGPSLDIAILGIFSSASPRQLMLSRNKIYFSGQRSLVHARGLSSQLPSLPFRIARVLQNPCKSRGLAVNTGWLCSPKSAARWLLQLSTLSRSTRVEFITSTAEFMRRSFPEREPTELREGDERGKVAGVSVGASKSWDRIGVRARGVE